MNKNVIGEIRVADEVVLAIAGLAATEVKGVRFLGNAMTHEKIARAGMKELQKSLKVSIHENQVEITLSVTVDGTVPIPELSQHVIEKVTASIESMTGMKVTSIIVNIIGVAA